MMPSQRYFPAVPVALASLLALMLLTTSSRCFVVKAVTLSAKSEPRISDSNISTIDTSNDLDNDSERHLFELSSPFEFGNDQCARECTSQDESEEDTDEGPLINACPKCHSRYTPCNFCCYEGASSLKVSFFGCQGNTSLVFSEALDDNGCNDLNPTETTSNALNSSVHFVDCDCYDEAIDASSSSFGDISSCTLFDHEVSDDASLGSASSYFDLCLVSTTDHGDGPVANFSQPLPDVVGLKHAPYQRTEFGDGDTVTFFETSCEAKGVDSHGNFDYPLYPGYGKFTGTCPHYGFLDFENENSRLPDDIVFLGLPPTTTSFYRFIDGTSVGFWPNANDFNNDPSSNKYLFFNPTFASCGCRDCDGGRTSIPLDSPSTTPSSDPLRPTDGTPKQPEFQRTSDVPSHSPSTAPSIDRSNAPSTLDPTASPPSEPSTSPSLIPSTSPSESPSGSYFPSVAPSNAPSNSPVPSTSPSGFPSTEPSIKTSNAPSTLQPTASPSSEPTTSPSLFPSKTPSELPSVSYIPSVAPSNAPSKSPVPSTPPSGIPSEHPSEFPTTHPSLLPSKYPSGSPSGSFFPSLAPSNIPSKSPVPSTSPSVMPSEHPSEFPTTHPSLLPSKYPSGSPSGSYFPSLAPSNIPSKSPVPSGSPTANPSEHPSEFPTTHPSLLPSKNQSGSPSGSFFPSLAPSDTPSKSPVPTSSPTTTPSEYPSEPPTHLPVSVASSSNPSGSPIISLSSSPSSDPVTYRCPPTNAPNNANNPVTPAPFNVLSTPSPTGFSLAIVSDPPTESTESPTDLSSTSTPTQEPTNAGCVDEIDCFVFAVGNCLNKDTGSLCIPNLNGSSRRFLEERIEFHQAELDKLKGK